MESNNRKRRIKEINKQINKHKTKNKNMTQTIKNDSSHKYMKETNSGLKPILVSELIDILKSKGIITDNDLKNIS